MSKGAVIFGLVVSIALLAVAGVLNMLARNSGEEPLRHAASLVVEIAELSSEQADGILRARTGPLSEPVAPADSVPDMSGLADGIDSDVAAVLLVPDEIAREVGAFTGAARERARAIEAVMTARAALREAAETWRVTGRTLLERAPASDVSSLMEAMDRFLDGTGAAPDPGALRLAAWPPDTAGMAEDFAAGADDLVAERERVAILLEEAAAGDVAGLSEHLAVLLETERARRPVLARSYDKGTVAALGVLVLLWILLALRGGGRTPPPRPVEEAPGPPSGDRRDRELLLRGVAAALVARAERIAGRTNALRESRLKLQAALEDANLDRTLHDGVPVRDEIAIMADVLADLRRETGELSSLGKRLEGLAPETAIDINACIEEAVGAAGARIARRFGDVADVRGRRPDIVLALTAIVDAALDAAGEKGTVTVATEPDGAEVAVTVAGAAFDAHPGVFRPDDEAGLRLVLASGLVERNGGALAILTEPDGGTAVRLSFPEA